MLNGFEDISAEEIGLLLQAPVLVTLLVGKADGKLDNEEKNWALKLVETKTYSNPKITNDFYEVVARDFLEKAEAVSATLPTDQAAHNAEISARLARINDVLPKLNPHLAYALYKSLLSLAKETANASGGFLRIGAVSSAEYTWVTLPMINKVEQPTDMLIEEEDKWDDDKSVED